MTEVTADSTRADELRGRLADELVAEGLIVSKQIEAAFRTVPRHLFAPEAALEEAYAQDIVVTKRDEPGITISSVSAPQIQAMMLEQAALHPGMRCLEIGSGGYNAALMAELVGEDGEVTTVDIDLDVIDRARLCLTEAGYTRVNVVLADGEDGCAEHAPYDRLIVTAGSWDIPPAWVHQLADGGTITVPLRMRGLTRSITFVRAGDHLVSRSAKICGFVKMQGAGAHAERLLLLRGKEIGLRFDDAWPVDADLLKGALDTTRVEAWSGVTVGRMEPFDTLQLWLATALEGFCLITVDGTLDTGLVAPVNRIASPAVVDAGSFAYLALRPVDEATVEFGAHAFGPDAAALAEALAQQIRVWDHDHRGGPGPRIAAYPADTPDEQLPDGFVITKRHVRVIISWPAAGQGVPHNPTEKE
ncbi:methyltransferase, FxLD system [Sphaerisporangium sp. NPDC088356]|uniref:methyltransferase, FxLD system n=1 Tax=Sphaerisporangium sp. NPDC088356 TaxID=3154871 RepID=UPI003419F723